MLDRLKDSIRDASLILSRTCSMLLGVFLGLIMVSYLIISVRWPKPSILLDLGDVSRWGCGWTEIAAREVRTVWVYVAQASRHMDCRGQAFFQKDFD